MSRTVDELGMTLLVNVTCVLPVLHSLIMAVEANNGVGIRTP
jgi:hypothetical protein